MDVQSLKPEQMLQVALMCSYAYYQRFSSLIADEQFDYIMKRLYECWDDFEHQHKYLLTKEDLKAGTAFKLKDSDYPEMVKQAAQIWMTEKAMKDNMELGNAFTESTTQQET